MQTKGRTQNRRSMDDNADLDETEDEHLDPEFLKNLQTKEDSHQIVKGLKIKKIERMEKKSRCGLEARSVKMSLI